MKKKAKKKKVNKKNKGGKVNTVHLKQFVVHFVGVYSLFEKLVTISTAPHPSVGLDE